VGNLLDHQCKLWFSYIQCVKVKWESAAVYDWHSNLRANSIVWSFTRESVLDTPAQVTEFWWWDSSLSSRGGDMSITFASRRRQDSCSSIMIHRTGRKLFTRRKSRFLPVWGRHTPDSPLVLFWLNRKSRRNVSQSSGHRKVGPSRGITTPTSGGYYFPFYALP